MERATVRTSAPKIYHCEVCKVSFGQKCHWTRHMGIHSNEKVICQWCSKLFSRRDKLNCHIVHKHQHNINKKQTFSCVQCGKQFSRKFTLKRHQILHTFSGREREVAEQSLLDEMRRNAHLYEDQLKMGQDIASSLQEYDDIPEQSLSNEHRKALEVYKQSRLQQVNHYEIVTLRLWQQKVISFIDEPNMRQVIWIVGKQGNEGKTFLQNYISNYYGTRRVVATDIAGRKKNIAHYLAKLPLECKDIFLFNHPASASESVAYDLLEDIKDGRTRSDKYSTQQIMFKIPNTVMIFSNEFPKTDALKKDRWRIYEIMDEELYDKAPSAFKRSLTSSFPDKLWQQKHKQRFY